VALPPIAALNPAVHALRRFRAHNRIIAALADTVVIVEARSRSGALITVDLAMKSAAR
jgi:predicted Rossmann fold nucleotide-binding protein DprA/Smf involved in DNA uptake